MRPSTVELLRDILREAEFLDTESRRTERAAFLSNEVLKRAFVRSVEVITTVCETNVHHPTDSSLLQDGVRVLQRLAGQAAEVLPTLGQVRDRAKAVRNRVLEITRAARSRGEQSKQRRERSYRALLRINRQILAAELPGKTRRKRK
jgi:hypothetical protein